MSVAPLAFLAVTVTLKDVPAVTAVGPVRISVSKRRGRAVQRRDDQIGHRRAQAGDVVIARPGRVLGLPVLVPVVMSWKSVGFWYRMFITSCGLVLSSAGWPARARP